MRQKEYYLFVRERERGGGGPLQVVAVTSTHAVWISATD